MSLPLDEARAFALELGLGAARRGPPDSVFRLRFAARAVGRLVRQLAVLVV